MVKLRRVYEDWCFESQKDLDDLKDHLGDDLYNDYMKIRNKIPKDQNDYKDFQKLKKLPIDDVRDFVSNFQSETDLRKEAKKGAKKIYENGDWLVYKITTYPAAKYYGSGTKWCITGRYPGHEGRGEEYFNDYIDENDLDDGYYFYISKKNPSEKYCVLQTKDKDIHSIWDARDTNRGCSYAELVKEGVVLPEIKEVNIPKYPLSKDGFFQSLDIGGEEALEYYLENGFDINYPYIGHLSYLFKVIIDLSTGEIEPSKAEDYVRILLEHGADPNIIGINETFVFSFVDDVNIAKLLLKYGADPNIKDPCGRGILHYVKDPDVIELVLNTNIDVNARSSNGKTPLMVQLNDGYLETIELLLEHGADPNLGNGKGGTPLLTSVINEDVDSTKLLLEHGADPNLSLVLGAAIFRRNEELLRLLLEYGADPNAEEDGMSMIDFAKNKGQKIIDILKEYGAKE